MFKRLVQKHIEEKTLFTLDDKVLVALSGGADSVALLCVLLSLGYTCECAHCNFHLRGEESNRDEHFVRNLCNERNVPLHIVHFETENYARANHLSIEMAARELRYRWFEELRKERGASVIAVAHHRDDSVETILLNLIRGTGINGLKGINVKNGMVVRPLLPVSRDEILCYLERIGQSFVTDSTNLKDDYMRNKIRLNLIPLMQELNPSVAESIYETGNRLAEVAEIYNRERENTIGQKLELSQDETRRISIASVLNDIAPTSLLFEILSPLGFNGSQIKDIFRSLSVSQSGKVFYSTEWKVLRDRDYLLIERIGARKTNPELQIEIVDITSSFVIPRDRHIACLDADRLTLPLVVRKWQKGDKFVPFGMSGKKKVSDYLTDRKFSLYQKENQFVVCSNDDIVWLVNERSDNRFRITENSRKALLIRIKS